MQQSRSYQILEFLLNCQLFFDSGVESGLDIIRALYSGADFVMMGGAWHYALGALGSRGPDHLIDILTKDLIANMAQLGVGTPYEVDQTKLD